MIDELMGVFITLATK
jgi:hypothetical protein